MKRTGLFLMLHKYTGWWVDLIRKQFPSTDTTLITGWMSYRIDNKYPYVKRDDLDLAYLLGHIAQYVPPLAALWLIYWGG